MFPPIDARCEYCKRLILPKDGYSQKLGEHYFCNPECARLWEPTKKEESECVPFLR